MTNLLRSWKVDWNAKSGAERVLSVRWLLNPNQSPIENVALIEQHGRILDIRPCKPSATDILPVVLIPTLVNAHTHLEFSSLAQPICPALPFQDWITAVIQWRQGAAAENSHSIKKGLAESRRIGVTVVGEITTTRPVSANDVAKDCQVVSFREVIGLQSERIPELLRVATEHLTQFSPANTTSAVVGGLSPHAPYTVHPNLFESLIDLAVSKNAVVAMHLAETTDEMELLHNGKGRFVEFLKRLNLWNPDLFPCGRSVREFLEHLARVPRALAIHGNYFSNEDIAFLADHPNVATVFCPRTHAYFRHTPHPISRLLAAGATVVLGTDSRASNPDLNLWKELQCAAAHYPDITIPQLVAMTTINAADALGLSTEHSMISANHSTRCVLLGAEQNAGTLRELICHSSTQPAATLIDGIAE